MTARIALNGFGRIGRQVLKILYQEYRDTMEVVGIGVTDPHKTETRAIILKYDSNYGLFPPRVEARVEGPINAIVIDGHEIPIIGRNRYGPVPAWAELDVDIVIEATGYFTKRHLVENHLKAGAKKVIITAPAQDEDITIVLGVNEGSYDPAKHHIISNASCTTNCLAPVAKVLNDRFGIIQGMMNTVHAYTNDQTILDTAHRDPRRARSGATNIVPTTTGAAKAIAKVIPELKGKFDGMAMRVPIPTVSIMDFVVELEQRPRAEEINAAFREEAAGGLKGILDVCDLPLVSTDFRGTPYSAVVDAQSTNVVGDLSRVVAWYDNEWGYACRVAELARYVVEKGL